MASKMFASPAAGLRRHAVGIVAAIAVAHGVTTHAQEGPDAADAPFPGRIYIAVPFPGDVVHGLLAVDPNAKTCATIDLFASAFVRVAPGGRKIAYSRQDEKTRKFSLFVLDLDRGGEAAPIFHRMVVTCWSKDGQHVLASLLRRDGDSTEPRHVRLKADGSQSEKLGVPPTDLIWDWSADGRWILTSSARGIKDGDPVPEFPFQPLYVAHLDGTDARLVVPAGALATSGFGGTMNAATNGPRFSPDGQSVLYIRSTTELEGQRLLKRESNLWVVDRDGQGRRVLFEGTPEEGYPYSVAWSPDGKALAVGLQKPRARNVAGLNEPRLLILDATGRRLSEIPLPHPTNMSVVDWR